MILYTPCSCSSPKCQPLPLMPTSPDMPPMAYQVPVPVPLPMYNWDCQQPDVRVLPIQVPA